MQNVITARLKKNIQIYHLLRGNAALAKSLILRLVLGALGGLPITSLALLTAFERLCFTFFDVYYSQKTKSPKRLVQLGISGLFFKVLADIILISIFFVGTDSQLLAPLFISVSGALLGIGQALTQGHIEDFYQSFARKYLYSLRRKAQVSHHAAKSFSYWSWFVFINIISIFFIVGLSYFLYNFYQIELLLFFTAALNLGLIFKIYNDEKKYESLLQHLSHSETMTPVRIKITYSAQTLFLALINSLSMLCLMTSCYFMFISLCLNETVKDEFNIWIVILMFILGYEYLGSLFSQWLSPSLNQHHKLYLFLGSGLILVTSLAFSRFHTRNFDFLPHIVTYVLFLIYPLLMSFGLKTIGSLTLNQIHQTKQIKSRELAYSTFPGHILMAAYCFYLVSNGVGIPTLSDSLDFNLNLSFGIFVLISLYLFLRRSQKAPSDAFGPYV